MAAVSQRISPFSTQVKLRRFDDSTLQILNLILNSKDLNLLSNLRRNLKEFLRSESLIAIRESADKPIDHKLLILDFLVRAFAIVDDAESCLTLRYEALVMRESHSISHPELRVLCSEWMNFAEDAFDSGFYSVATKACEYALMCSDIKDDARRDNLSESVKTVEKIQRLKDAAIKLSASHSVQVQATEYMRKKSVCLKPSSVCNKSQYPASISFRNGIKQQNVRNLQRLQTQAANSQGFNFFNMKQL